MTYDELLKRKKQDIIGALNLAQITISGDTTFEDMLGRVCATIDVLSDQKVALMNAEDFLYLQKTVLGEDNDP